MRNGESLWQERHQTLLLRLKWHKGCSLAAVVTGGRLGTCSSNPAVARGPLHCWAGCQNLGFPKAGRNSQVTVLVSALPALLLPPETSCTHGPRAQGLLSRAQALGITSCAISEALVVLPARRNSSHSREIRIKPLSHGEGRPQETLI